MAVTDERPASRDGAVGVSEISARVPVVARMAIGDDETFFMPIANHANPLPAYPPALLAQRLPPQSACLRVSIDDTGAVMDAVPVALPRDCPDSSAVDARFFVAATAAAQRWRFDPAVRCAYPNLMAQQLQDCTGDARRRRQ